MNVLRLINIINAIKVNGRAVTLSLPVLVMGLAFL